MQVSIKWGATFHVTGKGEEQRLLFLEWPDGMLEKDGKRISKAEAKRLREQGEHPNRYH